MNAQEALDLIAQRVADNNPMSVDELRMLANSVDASVSGSTLILYSGQVGDTSTYASWKVANALAEVSPINPSTGAHVVSMRRVAGCDCFNTQVYCALTGKVSNS